MILIECGGEETRYYDLVEASKLVGMNSESLRRVYRENLGNIGHKIGRTLFFTVQDLERFGYSVTAEENNFIELGEIIKLYPEEGTDDTTG
tara:strand:- start:324 stop:596 length:273 start_codon:yes stop_codon:yes gene_type:complete